MAGASPVRALKLFIAASPDGYIARPDGAVDWLWVDDDYGYAELYDSVDVLLMGRRTYEQVLTFGGDYPYRGKRSLVLSRAQAGGKRPMRASWTRRRRRSWPSCAASPVATSGW